MLPLALPKTPLCTVLYSVFLLCEAEPPANSAVFELAVAQNTAICSVFESAVQKTPQFATFSTTRFPKTLLLAICEVFYIFAQRRQASAMCKNTAKTNVSAQQKRRRPSPKQLRNHEIWPPDLPTKHMEKKTSQFRKSKTKN